jgi:hypothetical protein
VASAMAERQPSALRLLQPNPLLATAGTQGLARHSQAHSRRSTAMTLPSPFRCMSAADVGDAGKLYQRNHMCLCFFSSDTSNVSPRSQVLTRRSQSLSTLEHLQLANLLIHLAMSTRQCDAEHWAFVGSEVCAAVCVCVLTRILRGKLRGRRLLRLETAPPASQQHVLLKRQVQTLAPSSLVQAPPRGRRPSISRQDLGAYAVVGPASTGPYKPQILHNTSARAHAHTPFLPFLFNSFIPFFKSPTPQIVSPF